MGCGLWKKDGLGGYDGFWFEFGERCGKMGVKLWLVGVEVCRYYCGDGGFEVCDWSLVSAESCRSSSLGVLRGFYVGYIVRVRKEGVVFM